MAGIKKKDTRAEYIKESLVKLIYDPLGFVYWAYPWGKKGTPLQDEEGPDEWQKEVLNEIGELTAKQSLGDYGNVIQYAIKAGRGPGKTALIAWLMHWFVSTRPKIQGIVTANTKAQLETKTWRELGKWHEMSVHREFFEFKQSIYRVRSKDDKTWFITPIVWTRENPQAVAGAHDEYVIMVFDEASTIPDIIWETIDAGLTDKYMLWIVAGNPTEPSGRFKECWGTFKHRWIRRTIDSRTSKKADKEKIQQFIDDYGEDSDFVRVWVKGEFPQSSVTQFIPDSVVEAAVKRVLEKDDYKSYPIVIGVDVARSGKNRNAIYVRQGYFTHELWVLPFPVQNLMEMVDYILAKIVYYQNFRHGISPYVFIDVGMGYGIIDRLRQLGVQNIFEVNFGAAASQPERYANKRAEMYARGKAWLIEGGCIPDNKELISGLTGVQAGEDKRSKLVTTQPARLILKSKKTISDDIPLDESDSWACTFAMPVGIEIVDRRTRAQKMIDMVEGNPAAIYGTPGNYLSQDGRAIFS
uniref:Putative helicase n=1 Tax=viral metagenome TaxID=1070528 RepID=A0A6M3IFM5_9ZZZZ